MPVNASPYAREIERKSRTDLLDTGSREEGAAAGSAGAGDATEAKSSRNRRRRSSGGVIVRACRVSPVV